MRYQMNLLAGALVLVLFAYPFITANAALTLRADTDVATAGYFQLQWEAGETPTRLVESPDPEFENRRVVYAGPDTARLISGKSDGHYYYRLESAAGNQVDVVSNALQVTVQHHSLARAFTFFAIGAGVFLATLVLVLVGGRSERR